MKFLLSGEGATDIGSADRPGPMAVLADAIIKTKTGYSLLETGSCRFVAEVELSRAARALRGLALRGKKNVGLSGEFLKNARALADMANKAQVEEGPDCPVGAVLFHDCDGTNTSDRCRFEKKWESMESGFAREEFVYGIPMIPKPKSEAWLLCAFNTTPYQACAKLEELSGNDASPYSAKSKLDQRLTALGKTLNDLPDMVQKGSVDAARIDMPSFNMFRDRLSEVVRAMLGLPA